MRFFVRRTSVFDHETSPCPEAESVVGPQGRVEWQIEIGSLEELLEFEWKYGDLVLSRRGKHLRDDTPVIEIYDS